MSTGAKPGATLGKEERGVKRAAQIWLILIIASIVIPVSFTTIAFLNSRNGFDMLMYSFVTVPLVFSCLVVAGIIGGLVYWSAKRRLERATWLAALATPSVTGVALPLTLGVTYQDPWPRLVHGQKLKPSLFGRGVVTVTPSDLILQGTPKLRGYLAGGLGSAVIDKVSGQPQFAIPFAEIDRIQTVIIPPAFVHVFYRSGRDRESLICSFKLAKLQDFGAYWAAMGDHLPPAKLTLSQ